MNIKGGIEVLQKPHWKLIDIILVTLLAASIIWVASTALRDKMSAPNPAKEMSIEEMLKITLNITLDTAKKSGDTEAIKIAQYLKKNMAPGLVRGVKNNQIAVEQPKLKAGQQLIAIMPLECMKKLKRVGNRGLYPDEINAWFNPKDGNIYIVSQPGYTNLDVAIQLIHEGKHALRGEGKKAFEDPAQEEVIAYNLTFRVLAGIGGVKFEEAREEALDDLISGRTNDITGLDYDKRLDNILGPATTENCKHMRRYMLGMAAIWYGAEQKGLEQEKIIKEEFIKDMYRFK